MIAEDGLTVFSHGKVIMGGVAERDACREGSGWMSRREYEPNDLPRNQRVLTRDDTLESMLMKPVVKTSGGWER